jgi:lipoic acid synthetase
VEVVAVMHDLRSAGCDMLTLGQYLRPSKRHLPVAEFVSPAVFAELEAEAVALGFAAVASAPFVRSSYHAGELAGARGRREIAGRGGSSHGEARSAGENAGKTPAE